MRLKIACMVLLSSLLIGGVVFYFFVESLSQRRPDVIELSSSRQYIVERVPFISLFFTEPLSYLRITDQDSPEHVYRSPLYPTRLLEMQLSEDKGALRISDFAFLTGEKRFIFYSRQWKDHWMNRFVSNAPYSIEYLDESGK